jgi:hypothetical protein
MRCLAGLDPLYLTFEQRARMPEKENIRRLLGLEIPERSQLRSTSSREADDRPTETRERPQTDHSATPKKFRVGIRQTVRIFFPRAAAGIEAVSRGVQIMSLTAKAIRGDLEGLFPEIFKDPIQQPFLNDYVNIGVFLSGLSSNQTNCLAKLETRMQDRMFKKHGYADSKTGQQLIDKRRGYYIKEAQAQFGGSIDRLKAKINEKPLKKDHAFSKLLTDELADKETKWGFQLFIDNVGHPKAEMIMPLKADQFRTQLQELRPFKDPTIGPDHGEYTHRLQWYLIAEANVVAKPADVYKHLGLVPWQGSVFTKNGVTNFGLWDALVDRQPVGAPGLPSPFPFYKNNNFDFRCPEALLTWLLQPQQLQTYPLLSGFLGARKAKRAYVQNNTTYDDPVAEHYIALKLFGKPYTSLNDTDKGTVDSFIQGGQQTGLLKPDPAGPGYIKR